MSSASFHGCIARHFLLTPSPLSRKPAFFEVRLRGRRVLSCELYHTDGWTLLVKKIPGKYFRCEFSRAALLQIAQSAEGSASPRQQDTRQHTAVVHRMSPTRAWFRRRHVRPYKENHCAATSGVTATTAVGEYVYTIAQSKKTQQQIKAATLQQKQHPWYDTTTTTNKTGMSKRDRELSMDLKRSTSKKNNNVARSMYARNCRASLRLFGYREKGYKKR